MIGRSHSNQVACEGHVSSFSDIKTKKCTDCHYLQLFVRGKVIYQQPIRGFKDYINSGVHPRDHQPSPCVFSCGVYTNTKHRQKASQAKFLCACVCMCVRDRSDRQGFVLIWKRDTSSFRYFVCSLHTKHTANILVKNPHNDKVRKDGRNSWTEKAVTYM